MADKNANRRIGQAGVMRVKAELMLRGFDVAEPDVDCGVDLIAWDSRRFARIQVKSTIQNYGKDWARFHTTRLAHNSDKTRLAYEPRDIDFMVCVSIPNNQFWVIPASDVKNEIKMTMHIDDEYNNNWALISSQSIRKSNGRFDKEKALLRRAKYVERDYENVLNILKARKYSYEKDLEFYDLYMSNIEQYLRREHGVNREELFRIKTSAWETPEGYWTQELDAESVRIARINKKNYEELKLKYNNPANGTQGDPAAGCPPSVYAS